MTIAHSPHPTTHTELPTVVLIGRVNVGKSTLFNRLAGMHRSLVSPVAGTTRDFQDATITWRASIFRLVDTGGLDADADETGIAQQVVRHAKSQVTRANLVLFITDVREGILPADRTIAQELRSLHTPVILVVNKADSSSSREPSNDAWKLGFSDPLTLSALNGTGTGDLLDAITAELGRQGFNLPPTDAPAPLRLAIIGKPNVGKSTLVNAILGYERAVVSPLAHTTREPIDTLITWHDPHEHDSTLRQGDTPEPPTGYSLLLIDTAGIRKQAKMKHGLETAGVKRTLAVLARADIAIFVMDLTEGINDQDKNLAGLVRESGSGLLLVGNKWDLIRTAHLNAEGVRTQTAAERGAHWRHYVYSSLPYLLWAPLIFTSALNSANVQDILTAALAIAKAREHRIPEDEVREFFRAVLKRHPFPRLGPKRYRPDFIDFLQTGIKPPRFELTVRTKEKFPSSYARYVENELRKHYDFAGTPILVTVKTVR